jgi:pyruvate dehydrogenase E1 component alpha subunit/2-oxoisovalerate dehydrogenase E1 component alpha subunit
MYRYLRLTRALEERLVALYRQSKVIGGLFRSLGQEGESVASAYALDRGRHRDILSPLIRNLGSMLVMGAQPIEILRQYMAKAESPTRGRELNVHFNDLEKGYLGQISHLGDMVPVMAGITLTFKMRGEPRVGMVYVGDGATSTGSFHEGLNFAAVQRCPLVVVGEYNHWAYSTPPGKQFAVRHLAEKAKGYGIDAVTVDGNDVLAVYAAAKHAVERARRGAVDAAHVGVRVRAADDRGVQQAGETQVVDVAAAPGDESRVFLALERGADHVLRCSSRRRARSSST